MLKLQNDPNVPKLFAYCIPMDFIANCEFLSSATTIGEKIDVIHLAQSNWKKRIQIIDEILKFLQRTKPLNFNDLRRQQFVMINDHPTLVDFDDVNIIQNDEKNVNVENTITKRLYKSFIDGFLFQSNPSGTEKYLKQLQNFYENSTLTLKKMSEISEKLKTFT